jgi:hypothetical protein
VEVKVVYFEKSMEDGWSLFAMVYPILLSILLLIFYCDRKQILILKCHLSMVHLLSINRSIKKLMSWWPVSVRHFCDV